MISYLYELGDQLDKTSPPRYVKTWDSSVAHSQYGAPYPRSKQMTCVCRVNIQHGTKQLHTGA